MKVTLQHDVWRIELPTELVKDAGFSQGESLECQTFPGGLSLLSQSPSATGPVKLSAHVEKKFAA